MENEKKKWKTPKLICLYRGRPEEAVLTGCKVSPTSAGPEGTCKATPPKCQTTTGS